jgi:RIP metalloprotease RseP
MLDLIIYARSVDGDIRTVTLRRRGRRFDLNLPAGAAWFVKPETRVAQLRAAAGWEELVSYPWPQAIRRAVERTASSVGFLYSIPISLLRGLIPIDVVRPVGPVGIARLTGQAARQSAASGWWFPLLQLIATLSSALAVTNLLPLPGLDGGRLLFVGVEALRGQRLDPRRENLVHLVGLILMLMLILMVTYHDFAAPYPFGR